MISVLAQCIMKMIHWTKKVIRINKIKATKYIENYSGKPEMGMVLLFRSTESKILPITRIQSLTDFWKFAIVNNQEKLAYDLSKNLIESAEISNELSDYSILIARAHIFNQNFEEAEKWIYFAENYVVES